MPNRIPQDIQKNPKLFTVLDIIEYMNAMEKTRDIRKHDVDLGYADDLGFIMSKQSDWDIIWNEFLTTEYRNTSTYRKRIVENLGPSFLNMVY